MRSLLIVPVVLALVASTVWADGATPPSAFEIARQQAEIQKQRTTAKVREALVEAEQAIAAQRFPDADFALQEAQRYLRTAGPMAEEDLAALTLEAKRVRDLYQERLGEYLRAHEEKANREIAAREEQRRRSEQQFVARQLESQWARLRQARDVRDYDQAIAEARAILENNPNDEQARKELLQLEVLKKLAEDVSLRGDRRIETRLVLGDVETSSVPYSELYRYIPAAEWKALTEKRLRGLARQMGYTTQELAPPVSLQKRIDIKMTEAPLSSAVAYLSEATGVTIVADPHLQTDTGTSLDQEVITYEGRRLTLEQILNLILPQSMGWRVEGEQVIISSVEKANPLKTRIYPIQHMVAEIPDFGETVPRMNLQDTLQQGTGTGSGGAAGQLWQPAMTAEVPVKPEVRIIELITKMVKSTNGRIAIWEINGGTATIEYFNGSLIVCQTDEGHRQVALLLSRL